MRKVDNSSQVPKNQNDEITLFCQLGSTLSIKYFESKTTAEKMALCEALIQVATNFIDEHLWDQAISAGDASEIIAKDMNDRRLLGEVAFRRGLWHFHQGSLLAAMKSWEEALEYFQEAGIDEAVANCLSSIGIINKDLGRTHEAQEYLERALSSYKKIHHVLGQAATLSNLGLVLRVEGRLREALENYNQGLELFRQLRDPEGEAAVLGNIGIIYLTLFLRKQSVFIFVSANRGHF